MEGYFYIKDYRVFNPNFLRDTFDYMGLHCKIEEHIDRIDKQYPLNKTQKKAGVLTLKEKLNAFIDRVEFIRHCDLFSKHAIANNFVVMGQEVRGVHWDLSALRLYLALTCIDIFRNIDNQSDYFQTVFTQMPDDLKKYTKLNLKLIMPDGKAGDPKAMGLFFYNIRNNYTHAGKRFHVVRSATAVQSQESLSGTKNKKEQYVLFVNKNCDLVDYVLRIAIVEAKRRFQWL